MRTDETKTVVAVRGIPGSGKSHWSKQQFATAPSGAVARINNDDLSMMLFGSSYIDGGQDTANLLASLRAKTLSTLLTAPSIQAIIIDNTNLSVKSLRALENITNQHGANFYVHDEFLTTPLELCLSRNAAREIPVPESVIVDMHRTAQTLKPWAYAITPKITPHEYNSSLPPVIIFDIDGTLAHKHPDRDIYDGSLAHLDHPDPTLIPLANLLSISYGIIVMTGRSEEHRDVTQTWLDTHIQPGLPLLMRRSGDFRSDWIVKYELFDEHIRDRYHVMAVFDDRDQVVNLWRNRLGIPTYQVAEGNF